MTLRSSFPKMLLFLACVSVLHSVQAQTEADRPGLIAEGCLGFGGGAQSQPVLSLQDWRTVLPNSAILMQDVPADNGSGRQYDSYRGNGPGPDRYGDQSGSVYVGLGLDLGRNAPENVKFQKRLRLGVSYSGLISSQDSRSRASTARYDTLVSQSTGQFFFRDTTYSERYNINYSSSRIGLDVAYVVRSVSASRWAWYVGIGGQLGASINNEAYVSFHVSHPDLESTSQEVSSTEDTNSEYHRLGSTFWGAGYALAGVDLLLSRKSAFLSNLHLFYELRPAVLFSAPSGIPTRAQGAVQQLLGLRFNLR